MKKKPYNTTVDLSFYDDASGEVKIVPYKPSPSVHNKYLIDPTLSDAKVGDCVLSNSYVNFHDAILKYHHQTNLMHSEEYFSRKIKNSRIGDMAHIYTAYQFSRMCSLESSYDHADLVALDHYLCTYMLDPAAFGACPVIDMLHLTLDISSMEIKNLRKSIKTVPKGSFSLVVSGLTKQLKNNHEAFERYAQFENHLGEYITLYWGMRPEVRQKRKTHRLGKLSFNPARFTRKELKVFFRWLKSVIGSKGQEVIKTANVTRVDIALDVVGVSTNTLLLDQPRSGKMKIILNQLRQKNPKSDVYKAIGSMSIGPDNSSRTIVYDKGIKLFYVGPKHIPLLWRERLVNISRIERKHNPADSKPYQLVDLASRTPFFLKGAVLYRPLLLSQLDTKQLGEIRSINFTHWLRHGKTRKVRKASLDSFSIRLDEQYFKGLQHKELQYLTKVILEA